MDITITPTWQSLNTLSSIAVGTSLKLQNKGKNFILVAEGSSAPLSSSKEGEVVTTLFGPEPSKIIATGSEEIWVRTINNGNTTAFVQEL